MSSLIGFCLSAQLFIWYLEASIDGSLSPQGREFTSTTTEMLAPGHLSNQLIATLQRSLMNGLLLMASSLQEEVLPLA
jgi:hypothetical protein